MQLTLAYFEETPQELAKRCGTTDMEEVERFIIAERAAGRARFSLLRYGAWQLPVVSVRLTLFERAEGLNEPNPG